MALSVSRACSTRDRAAAMLRLFLSAVETSLTSVVSLNSSHHLRSEAASDA
ncbi:MAG: hypothetical protein ACLR76_11780 [Alistipes sp.]